MRRVFSLFLLSLLALVPSLSMHPALCAAESTPPKGGMLPELILASPSDSADVSYLGLQGKKQFKIPDIQAQIVLIEVFSMYCPYCQREAPLVNEFYRLVGSRAETRDRIKLIGIGVGNSEFEVNFFRTRYKVPFPLLPDPGFSAHKILGQPRTPYFIGVRMNKDGTHKVIYSHLGTIEKPEALLKMLQSHLAKEGK